jgi:hypothetical protein
MPFERHLKESASPRRRRAASERGFFTVGMARLSKKHQLRFDRLNKSNVGNRSIMEQTHHKWLFI